MVFLGHQGLVWDTGVSSLLGWGGETWLVFFWVPQLPGVEGPQGQKALACLKLCTAAAAPYKEKVWAVALQAQIPAS